MEALAARAGTGRNGSGDHPPSHLCDAKATPLSPLVQLRQSCPRCGHKVRRGEFSEANHPVSEDGDGVRLSEEQRLEWLSREIEMLGLSAVLSHGWRVQAATMAASIFFIASRSASGSSNKWP